MVAAAFAALSSNDPSTGSEIPRKSSLSPKTVDDLIAKSNTANDLLKIADQRLERTQALKIVSVIAEWHSLDRIKLDEFENDARFIKLCKILGNASDHRVGAPGKRPRGAFAVPGQPSYRNEDLNTVLSVTGDDEAAKLISNVNLTQMVKIMSSLAQKRRRSVPLLRALALNITNRPEQIEPKGCADLLYSMAMLNFFEPNLIARVVCDFQKAIAGGKIEPSKSAIIGSVCTSLGMIKYRDTEFIEVLGRWLVENRQQARPQDISAFVMTGAVLNARNAISEDLRSVLAPLLVREDFSRAVDYLNHVWALTLLEWSSKEQVESMFTQVFVNKLFQEAKQNASLVQSVKMKLLNINAAARLLMRVDLQPLGESFDMDWNTLSKSKQVLVGSLMDTLNTLLPVSSATTTTTTTTQKGAGVATDLIRTNFDTKMGFYVDAICVLDQKRNRLPVDSTDPKATRIAMMTMDYHDYCQSKAALGSPETRDKSGIADFTFRLLERSGFRILEVPYSEFGVNEKLLKRVQFLEARLKKINLAPEAAKSV